MIVAVQKGLGTLKESLRAMGYDTVTYGEYKYPIDAIVFMGSAKGMVMERNESCGEHGVLLVNASGKTPHEIDLILKRRLYTPLF